MTDVWKALQSQLDVAERNPLSQVNEMRQAFDAKRVDGVLRCSPKLTINDTVISTAAVPARCFVLEIKRSIRTYGVVAVCMCWLMALQRSGVLSRISALNSLHTLSQRHGVLVSCRLTTTPPMPSSHRKNSCFFPRFLLQLLNGVSQLLNFSSDSFVRELLHLLLQPLHGVSTACRL